MRLIQLKGNLNMESKVKGMGPLHPSLGDDQGLDFLGNKHGWGDGISPEWD